MKTVGWSQSGHAIVEMTRTEWLGLMRGVHVDRFDELATLVKDYRRQKKLNLRKFGRMCKVSASTISRIERGETPTLENAIRLSKAIQR